MKCRLIEVRHPLDGEGHYVIDIATAKPPVPGDMFFELSPERLERNEPGCLSDRYKALPEPRRPPIWVILPTGRWFCIDMRYYEHEKGGWWGDGWSVSGTPPDLTLSPSINAVGNWHGWLQNGELHT